MKAVILDRDGTLIEHVPYLRDASAVRLLPGVIHGLRRLTDAGVSLYLHTNQSGIGRGYFTLREVHACNDRMIELLGLGAAPFQRICIAPEHPDEASDYRKPSPRFAHEIAAELNCTPFDLCYLGDRGSDLATAAAAGTLGVGVATGLDDLASELAALGLAGRYPLCASFGEAVESLLAMHTPSPVPSSP